MVKMQLIGHLGKDAVIGKAGEKTVINMTVAHGESYTDNQGNKKDKTLWVDCSYWTEKTGVAAYLLKGTQVHLDGVPDVSSYEKEGKTVPKMTLRVLNVQLLGGTQQVAPQQAPQQQRAPQQAIPGQTYSQPQFQQPAQNSSRNMDDLPF